MDPIYTPDFVAGIRYAAENVRTHWNDVYSVTNERRASFRTSNYLNHVAAEIEMKIPTASELNPDHPVTKATHDSWHKIVALIVMKYKIEPVFTLKELHELLDGKSGELAVVLEDKNDILKIRLVSMAEAEALAKSEGLPK